MKFAIPDNVPVVHSAEDAVLQPLRERGELALYSTRHTSDAELIERMRGAVAAINVRAYSKFTEEVLVAVPNLKFQTVVGAGTDNIDLTAATKHGVVVSNMPTAPAISVPELAIALTLGDHEEPCADAYRAHERCMASSAWNRAAWKEVRVRRPRLDSARDGTGVEGARHALDRLEPDPG